MSRSSDPLFLTFHALRIKGFASAQTLATMAQLPEPVVDQHLADLMGRDWAKFREKQQLWQLTPVGRDEHRLALEADVGDSAIVHQLSDCYDRFLALNDRFKQLCGDWQLRAGAVNDHADAAYDAGVVDRLVALNDEALPVVEAMAQVLERLRPYGQRLVRACQKVVMGEMNMFTGVMCGSYHDVWMELHEDLILTQSIDRSTEGSF